MEAEAVSAEKRQQDEFEFCSAVDSISTSMSAARQVVTSLIESHVNAPSMKDGISLLSLKHHLLLSYMQSLTLLSAHRALGHSFVDRTPPAQSFSDSARLSRGTQSGDLIDANIETRIVLEKIKVLELRMKYQIDKLVRVATEPTTQQSSNSDPLAFRPNPANFNDDQSDGAEDDDRTPRGDSTGDAIYRPPRLAPVPYTDAPPRDKSKKTRAPLPSALSALQHADPHIPHVESTSGLGAAPAHASARARALQRITEFEEGNFTRLVVGKKEERRRRRDEEDVALGGAAGGRRGGAGALEVEFGDVFRSVERTGGGGGGGDGYEELRKRGRKGDVLERSRANAVARSRDDAFGNSESEGRTHKRSRFELETKSVKKKLGKAKK